jgi:hypothetical protein
MKTGRRCALFPYMCDYDRKMMLLTRVAAIAGIVAIAVIAAACGGSDSGNPTFGSPPSATVAATLSPSPSPPPQPVTANGEFTCVAAPGTVCSSGLEAGKSPTDLRFDLSGGPASGTTVGETSWSTPGCSWDARTQILFYGQFTAETKTFAGVAEVKETQKLTQGPIDTCWPGVPGGVQAGGREDHWQAVLESDARTINGCLGPGEPRYCDNKFKFTLTVG